MARITCYIGRPVQWGTVVADEVSWAGPSVELRGPKILVSPPLPRSSAIRLGLSLFLSLPSCTSYSSRPTLTRPMSPIEPLQDNGATFTPAETDSNSGWTFRPWAIAIPLGIVLLLFLAFLGYYFFARKDIARRRAQPGKLGIDSSWSGGPSGVWGRPRCGRCSSWLVIS